MYDPIFAKSFSRHDRKRFGCFALLFSLIIALTICSTSKPSLHPFSIIGEAMSLQLSINSMQDLLIDGDITYDSHKLEPELPQPLSKHITVSNKTVAEQNRVEHVEENRVEHVEENREEHDNVIRVEENRVKHDHGINAISERQIERNQKEHQTQTPPLCRVLKSKADYCDIEGDVRVDSNSSTVFLIRPRSSISSTNTTSWTIQPYPRKGITFVKQWTVKLAYNDEDSSINTVPQCTRTHSSPALLFSNGGFTGNHFHDFADLLFPLFTTSFRFERDVHFLISDNKPWWLSKYQPLLHKLTQHQIIDTAKEINEIHCYKKLIAGLKFHRELMVDPTSDVTMTQFRHLLRRTYSLDRNKAVVRTRGGGAAVAKPRLMIVSRKRTRILTNEGRIARLAGKLGFEVVSAEGKISANLTKFAQLVNSCDVMMGVHGAGLTNMVFLPEKAVVIQVVPLGAIDVFAKLDFGDPSVGMKIRYLEYRIGLKESSLLERYGVDDPVIRDPLSVHRQGWGKLREVYLHNQNVTIDVARFRRTLVKALKLLRS